MPKKKTQLIKVINKLTGEVYEHKLATIEDAEQAYLILSGMEGAVKRAKIKVVAFLDKEMGDEEKWDFGDGYIATRVSGFRRKYQKPIVAQYLNEDQLDLVTDINGTKLKDLIKNLVEEKKLPVGAWKDIEAKAEITPIKPYIKVTKA